MGLGGLSEPATLTLCPAQERRGDVCVPVRDQDKIQRQHRGPLPGEGEEGGCPPQACGEPGGQRTTVSKVLLGGVASELCHLKSEPRSQGHVCGQGL